MPPRHLHLARLFPAQPTFVVTTNNDTITQQPAEDSIPNESSIGVTPTIFSDLMSLPHRERTAAKCPREKPSS